jgi:hypothetical protein
MSTKRTEGGKENNSRRKKKERSRKRITRGWRGSEEYGKEEKEQE